jgi:hypothetical protein
MKHHFDYQAYPGISYEYILQQPVNPIIKNTINKSDKSKNKTTENKVMDTNKEVKLQEKRIELVQDISSSLFEFNVKLSAAFARLRIEHQAIGSNAKEKMLNLLPKEVLEKEELAMEVPKTFKLVVSRMSVDTLEKELKRLGVRFQANTNVLDLE